MFHYNNQNRLPPVVRRLSIRPLDIVIVDSRVQRGTSIFARWASCYQFAIRASLESKLPFKPFIRLVEQRKSWCLRE